MHPQAFRIQDFRSITDSGVCTLSGDNITVLAGQNEAGKTAILNALRDFDLAPGEPPQTPEFMPEGRHKARPRVSIKFECSYKEIKNVVDIRSLIVPEGFLEYFKENSYFWVERDLLTGIFKFSDEVLRIWPESTSSVEDNDENESESIDQEESKINTASEVVDVLYSYWPSFIYFDSFQDKLPREIPLSSIITTNANNVVTIHKDAPQPVKDFITLADLDLELLITLQKQDKALENYLQTCGATITGDFLTYWKQRVTTEQSVNLHVRHIRDTEGNLKLAFYIQDNLVSQYPEQRSKGFLWFLSFYLRLTAARKRDTNSKQLLLIDEPGSYLHARAQRDVLDLFEDRIAPSQHIIYSTHSPFLLPASKLHRIRIVIKKHREGTLIVDRLTHPSLRTESFSDTLSPIITAIGLDMHGALTLTKEQNLIVEGMSDLLYIGAWSRQFQPDFLEKVNIFPGTGATTIPMLASLFIGWGLSFSVLLDRDNEGNKVREKLLRELSLKDSMIVQPNGAIAIEDIFSAEDFRSILKLLDDNFDLLPSENPSAAVKRQKIDKILLARTYAENIINPDFSLTKRTQESIERLLKSLSSSFPNMG